MKKTVIALGCLTVLAGCSEAHSPYESASDPHHRMMSAHHSLDKMGSAFFKMMDANADGIVTREERSVAPHQEWLVDFTSVDFDGDGKLTQDEYLEALKIHHPAIS